MYINNDIHVLQHQQDNILIVYSFNVNIFIILGLPCFNNLN